MIRLLVVALLAGGAALPPYHAASAPVSPTLQRQVIAAGEWHKGCPVGFSQLRVLSVSYVGFDGKAHEGQLLVNRTAVAPLKRAFARLYTMRFPIRHMALSDTYGTPSQWPKDGDVSASFECRQAAASPCTGGRTGSWSNHAYGLAVDVNPVENPYVGCGQTRDKTAVSYMNRARLRPGMVTPAVVQAFTAAGWYWAGAWAGSTKDYMHFSYNGH